MLSDSCTGHVQRISLGCNHTSDFATAFTAVYGRHSNIRAIGYLKGNRRYVNNCTVTAKNWLLEKPLIYLVSNLREQDGPRNSKVTKYGYENHTSS